MVKTKGQSEAVIEEGQTTQWSKQRGPQIRVVRTKFDIYVYISVINCSQTATESNQYVSVELTNVI